MRLKTEINTRTMGKRVIRAARIALCHRRKLHGAIQADFEHGQWWITFLGTGAQWSVCDADGTADNGVVDGFCFEQVTEGDEA